MKFKVRKSSVTRRGNYLLYTDDIEAEDYVYHAQSYTLDVVELGL